MKALAIRLIQHRPARFIGVGILNTIFGYLVYLFWIAVGLRPELALAVSTSIGACFNYVTTGRLVFRHSSPNRIVHFFASYAALYVVNALALRELVAAGVRPALAQGLLVLPFAIISYLVFKFIVFRQREGS
ncbi:GtrA family protein [Kaistia algarum]|uniref:GtrA family protein n=1 Tax=Kaistia algarum TaxID=2083279 RepID=UPI001402188B|nr:GtrA family protein [Kaistia algarum]